MNLLANLSATYRRSLVASDPAIIVAMATNEKMSPYEEMMKTLHGLRQHDLSLYRRVKKEAVTTLQIATRAAESAVDIRKVVARQRNARLQSAR